MSAIDFGTILKTGLFCLAAVGCARGGAGAGSGASTLPSAERDRLSGLGVTVAVPEVLPPGFRFAEAQVETSANNGENYPDYKLRFCNDKKQCFYIESAYGEIGDGPDGSETASGHSLLFGAFSVDYFRPGAEGNEDPQAYVLSSWMPDEAMRQATAAGLWPSKGRYHHLRGHGLSLQEAVQVIASLRALD